MHEPNTFDFIMQRMLNRVPNNIDKREGSIIYDALAPACAEIAQLYIELDLTYRLTFADTATGVYLTRRAMERGIIRRDATKAIRLGKFYNSDNDLMDVPLNSRYSIDGAIFKVTKQQSLGNFEMECETAGTIGNILFGDMMPLENVQGLRRAELADILIPAEDVETDEQLRKRYFESLNATAFGGNVADYQQKTLAIHGVGAVKIFPVWNGGGTVKVVFLDSEFNNPSQTLIDLVQTTLDPTQNNGEGLGLAPIGHVVTVKGVDEVNIDISFTLTFESGYTWADVEEQVNLAIEGYFLSLKQNWQSGDTLVVRISQIESQILNVTGIVDITGTTLNGGTINITLQTEEIPKIGTVINND